MAEVLVQWADGRSERRSVLPGQVTTIGDSRLPVLCDAMPLGLTLVIGHTRLPFARVRVHGEEMPYMQLITGAAVVLEGARAARKRIESRSNVVTPESSSA